MMNWKTHFFSLTLCGLAFAALAAGPAQANNVLANPGFEEPQVASAGNNFPAVLPGWTLQTSAAPCFDGHNVVLADGSPYDGGPDQATEGSQYYDICGAAGYLEQSFTMASASAVSFGASFSRRDATGGGNVEIFDASNSVLIMASRVVSVDERESQELWVVSSATIPNLEPGTYIVRINIDDTANADAAFVTVASSGGVVGDGTAASITEAALDCALAGATPTISFNGGSAPVVIPFTGTKPISRNMTFNGGNKVTLSGQGAVPLFVVNPGVTLTLQDIILDRGYTAGSGGAIRNQGTLVLSNARISNSVAGAHGGAIQNSGSLTCTGTRFEYNRAGTNGGAIDNTGTLILTNCTATNNAAGFRGGGFYNYLGSMETTNCVIKWGTAGAYGGGMAVDGGTVQFNGGLVRGNRSSGGGGGLSLNANATVRGAEVSLNTAAGFGGGVDVVGGTATLDDIRLYTNVGSLGGGLATHAGTTSVARALIQYNRNTGTQSINSGGGGVYVDAGSLTITASRISTNRSNYAGGGVMVNYSQKAVLKNCTVAGNVAGFGQLGSQLGTLELEDCSVGPGGSLGIWSDGGTLTMSRSTVFGHNGAFYGGGISLRRGAAATIINSTISGNSAFNGGGIFLESGFGGSSAELTNVTVAGNSAQTGGNLYIGPGADVSVTLKNTIIANPVSGGNCAGKEVSSSRYSISSDNLCALAGPGDRNGTDPLLGPLQNNGGPTLTHMPLPGSPAIDGVLGTQAPAIDQSGRNRPAGLGYDIGAVEANAGGGIFINPPPASTFDGNDTGDDDGDGTRDGDELIAGTDPNSPADVFRLSISPTNPLQVTFPSKSGKFYRVYVSHDQALNPLAQWISAAQGTITGNGGIQSFTITPTAGVARRFYIVRAMATDGPWP